ncbi:PTPA-CTERM sorting domain-containing protein [Oculatella sp. LEGE 06141]|uniref:PTPA-CTERM sorting domain-containing protein n=1 Tax=Oculatella sp. LEGE 06141 TaxID=1828648 RepID=UPI00187E5F08|nr:PTPA-CTERM sorting domain-containing protein [Oculatella sp. LEGE 06141]MBE9179532.1 PTPA-CTERM sorting domain-containing protein [Oculatella sp. LEGE 06141]
MKNFLAGTLIAGTLAISSLMQACPAEAVTFESLPLLTDNDFRDLLNSGDFVESFVVEGRIGTGSSGIHSERELGINNLLGQPLVAGQLANWASPYNFSLMFDGNNITYKLDNQTLTTTVGAKVNRILVRTFAQSGKGNVTLSDLVFNGEVFSGLLTSDGAGGNDVSYLNITGFSTPFTLTGKALISANNGAARSQLAYQFKAGFSPEPIPTPALLPGLIGMGVAVLRKKQDEEDVEAVAQDA